MNGVPMADDETPKGDDKDVGKQFTQADIDAAVEKATGGLKAKVDELLTESKEAKRKAKEAAEQAAEEARKKAEKEGDVEALRKSYEEREAKLVAEHSEALAGSNKQIHALTAGAAAASMAGEMAVEGSAAVLQQLIAPRIGVEVREGVPVAVPLGADGKPMAGTLDDLRKEIAGTAAYKPLITGTKASGGGAPNANGGAGAGKQVPASQIEAMTPVEKAAFFKANPGVEITT